MKKPSRPKRTTASITSREQRPIMSRFFSRSGRKTTIAPYLDGLTCETPVYRFTTDDQFGVVLQEFWVINDDTAISRITELFGALPAFYVADGHHRSASAFRVWQQLKRENPNHTGREEYNFFLAVVFPQDQLFIYDYNRVVKDLNGLSKLEFLSRAGRNSKYRRHTPRKNPRSSINSECTWTAPGTDGAETGTLDPRTPLASLDVAILQKNLLAPCWESTIPKQTPASPSWAGSWEWRGWKRRWSQANTPRASPSSLPALRMC